MTVVLSRRGVLGAGAVAVGAGLAAGGLPAAAATSSSIPSSAAGSASAVQVDPLLPVRSLFTGREGVEFVGFSPWSEHRLVLVEVGDLAGAGDAEHRFRLAFTTDEGARDGIYRILKDGALIASLFLAAVTDAPILEAIVDRQEARS
ncbi:hypothetical protein [Microbacterium hydrocarbonoxydans]|uniref:hypothetical protein n=1 Tax=Microbacterium hydrocarbonoxydans TaxID=273678 RepID=UPI003D972DDB